MTGFISILVSVMGLELLPKNTLLKSEREYTCFTEKWTMLGSKVQLVLDYSASCFCFALACASSNADGSCHSMIAWPVFAK